MAAPIRSRHLKRWALLALLLIPVLMTIGVRLWLRSDAVRATVERQATAALRIPVRIGTARVTVFPRLGLDLYRVEIGDPVSGSVDRVSIATGFELLLSRRVEAADVELSGGYLDASVLGGLAALGAAPPAAAGGAPEGNAPFAIVSISSVRFRDVTLIAGRDRVPTSLDASLAGDRLDISNLAARFGTATVHVDGQVSSVSRREGHFVIRSDALPVDALFAVVGALSGKSAGRERSATPLRITANVSAPVARLGDTRVESLETRLQTTSAGIVFDPLAFTVHGGRVEGRMIVDTSGQRATLDVRGTVSGVDVAALRQTDAGGRGMTGRLGARFTLRAPAEPNVSALIGAARGPIEMDIRDGRMPGIEVIGQVVTRYANRSEPAVRARGTDAYRLLRASLSLQAGTAVITALEMNSDDFDVTGSGTLSLSSGSLSLAVDVILSESLSQEAGRDLYRYARQDKRIVLPALVGGTLSHPTASIDIGEATGRALKNRIEEEVKSIFDRALKGVKR